ncbi:MAG: hypothetical protein RIS54_2122 [Verrucomicrobiota bacterium]|jgi:hypothetical protein
MSLINNALKKAQRQRAAESAAAPPSGGGGGRSGRNGPPAQLFILLIAGAAVIVVLSVVATVYLLRPAAAPVPTAEPSALATTAATPLEDNSAPAVSVPVAAAAPSTPEPEPARVNAAPAVDEPATALSPAVINATADERVYAFIDELQVMGVRSSGTGSKVLMKDRVYRVNDIVNRTLGLRLIKVTPESLVFEDANGITYTKTF